jgi:hypothetical protein
MYKRSKQLNCIIFSNVIVAFYYIGELGWRTFDFSIIGGVLLLNYFKCKDHYTSVLGELVIYPTWWNDCISILFTNVVIVLFPLFHFGMWIVSNLKLLHSTNIWHWLKNTKKIILCPWVDDFFFPCDQKLLWNRYMCSWSYWWWGS